MNFSIIKIGRVTPSRKKNTQKGQKTKQQIKKQINKQIRSGRLWVKDQISANKLLFYMKWVPWRNIMRALVAF